ncbi:hypothetical protein PIB30_063587 [Stylosanthes scabra]|uniref:CCHC-type domain-containing protein n=1 Tax=Stylosanthes scabra TaxID=79078 RepID=A0ABU6QLC1_9FABA|nr:hypothetical protein [Stylosanthes scabra]
MEKPEDYVHPWLCMKSIHATYKHIINPVPSEQYWGNRNYLKTEAPYIKRPIRRPKVHNRRRDPVENLMEGNNLKRTFRVTCAKCGEQGHNYKTCKGAPANPGWKPKGQVGVSQEAPSHTLPAPAPQVPASCTLQAPFKPPGQVGLALPTKRRYRPKQPIRRQQLRSSPTPSAPPSISQPMANVNQGAPSSETVAAASTSTQRILKFMETPGFQKK